MPDFGVTDTGYILPSQQQLLALMVADEKATIGPNVDTGSDSVLGQINGVVTRQLMILYEGQQVAYSSNDPDVVEGFLQTSLAKLTGTPRLAATKSTVKLTCVLDPGTALIAGTTLAAVQGKPDSQWTPVADFMAPGGIHFTSDAYVVSFESTTTGPNEAEAGTITVMTTPVVGWTGVVNPLSAAVGTDVESDSDLRIRREQEIAGGGASNADAIRAALLKVVDSAGHFVISAWVLNNYSDATDANGVPPHSTEAIIWDGPTAPISNDLIAQTLWDEGSAGIRNYGLLSGTAIDALGNPQTVRFSRVQQVLIYLAFGVTPRAGYVGDAAFKAAVAEACNGNPSAIANPQTFGINDDVDSYDVTLNTLGLGGQVTGLAVQATPFAPGYVPSSIATTVLPISPRQIAIFDSARVTVNGS